MTAELIHRDLRAAVADAGRDLLEEGLTKGTGGNVSARTGDDVVITPSGVPYETLEPADISVVDLHGEQRQGEFEPSSETPMHTRIYRQRDEIGGIVHTHSPNATTFAALGEPIPASHYLLAVAGREVPVAGYAPPGTEELGRLAADALGDDHDACLLKNHGLITVGHDTESAFKTALLVEFCARVHYQAMSIGSPDVLADAEVDELRDIFESYDGV